MGVYYSVSPLPGRIFFPSSLGTMARVSSLLHMARRGQHGPEGMHYQEPGVWSWGILWIAFRLLFRSSSCFPTKGQFPDTEVFQFSPG